MIKMTTGIQNAAQLLQGSIKNALLAAESWRLSEINEIRLRLNKHVSFSAGGKNMYLARDGKICESATGCLTANESDIEYAFKTAYSYSLHSYSKELAMGHVTTRGGNRVGICGTAVTSGCENASVESVKYISGVNIRIARQVKGFADRLFAECFCSSLSGVLIVGPPSSGKTTLLRDLARLVGSCARLCIIDCQNEISATYRGNSENDIGELTDVFVGYPKHSGVSTAIRVMSPQVIMVDEIGSEQDLVSLEYALHSGVKLITAVHAKNLEDALKKPCIKALVRENAFEYAAELSDGFDYAVTKIA